jgi:hypothetical protein
VCNHANDPLIQQADAYADAVAALAEITNGAPLSTTIGSLIRSGWLIPDPERLAGQIPPGTPPPKVTVEVWDGEDRVDAKVADVIRINDTWHVVVAADGTR